MPKDLTLQTTASGDTSRPLANLVQIRPLNNCEYEAIETALLSYINEYPNDPRTWAAKIVLDEMLPSLMWASFSDAAAEGSDRP